MFGWFSKASSCDVYLANSIRVQPVVLLESRVPFGKAHPSSSCKPLFRCKQLVVCHRGRLHATLFGKIAFLAVERVSNCPNIPYFDEVSPVFLYGTILGFVKSHGVSSIHSSSSIGFTFVKNTDCLPLLGLSPR